MSTEDHDDRPQPDDDPSPRSAPQPIPDRVLAMILVLLAVALVLGYLLVNKMADISHQEDCVLAHRRDC